MYSFFFIICLIVWMLILPAPISWMLMHFSSFHWLVNPTFPPFRFCQHLCIAQWYEVNALSCQTSALFYHSPSFYRIQYINADTLYLSIKQKSKKKTTTLNWMLWQKGRRTVNAMNLLFETKLFSRWWREHKNKLVIFVTYKYWMSHRMNFTRWRKNIIANDKAIHTEWSQHVSVFFFVLLLHFLDFIYAFFFF